MGALEGRMERGACGGGHGAHVLCGALWEGVRVTDAIGGVWAASSGAGHFRRAKLALFSYATHLDYVNNYLIGLGKPYK